MDDLKKCERDLRANMEMEEKFVQPRKGMRESLYNHIHVSVCTMNIVICVIALLLIVSIIIGIVQVAR